MTENCEECHADIWYIKSGGCPLLNIFNNKLENKILSLVTAKTRSSGGISAGEISRELKTSDSHIYPALNKLIKLGFIEKHNMGKINIYKSKLINTNIIWKNGYIHIINCPKHK